MSTIRAHDIITVGAVVRPRLTHDAVAQGAGEHGHSGGEVVRPARARHDQELVGCGAAAPQQKNNDACALTQTPGARVDEGAVAVGARAVSAAPAAQWVTTTVRQTVSSGRNYHSPRVRALGAPRDRLERTKRCLYHPQPGHWTVWHCVDGAHALCHCQRSGHQQTHHWGEASCPQSRTIAGTQPPPALHTRPAS